MTDENKRPTKLTGDVVEKAIMQLPSMMDQTEIASFINMILLSYRVDDNCAEKILDAAMKAHRHFSKKPSTKLDNLSRNERMN